MSAVLSISVIHSGNFTQGSDATYAITVTNTGTSSTDTAVPVVVSQLIPAAYTFVSMTGTGWTVTGSTATRSDALAPSSSYPVLTVTVAVAANATSPQTVQAFVTGGAITTVDLRFLSVPEQDYTSVLTYQSAPPAMLMPGSVWPLPDQYLDVYNNLFLAEVFQAAGNSVKSDEYRKRGMAALISKFCGLTDVQRSWYLAQTNSRAAQSQASTARTLAGQKSRGT
jgi:uncharacterized repeat protein (TIGR01451 family)